MKYTILGRWCSIGPNHIKNIQRHMSDALSSYSGPNYYYESNKHVSVTAYNLEHAAKVLLSIAPDKRVDIVRVEVSNFILVTLAIQVAELECAWSSTGSICLEEMIKVLQGKGPEYYNAFMEELKEGKAV